MSKMCSRCKIEKSLTQFIKDNRRKDGRGSWCYDCHKLAPSFARKQRSASNCVVCEKPIQAGRTDKLYCSDKCGARLRHHRYKLKKYGLTIEQYFHILDEQGGVCAICHRPETTAGRWLMSVDHCHTTMRVRGLLCGPCNSALGLFKDDPDAMRRAADYIETPKTFVEGLGADCRFDYSERVPKTDCPKGDEHGPYDRVYSNGHRYCSKCHRENERRRRSIAPSTSNQC